jgi:predicted PurR-regulated permease PerM
VLFVSIIIPPFADQFQELLRVVPEGVESFANWVDGVLRNPPDWFPDDEIRLPDLSDLTGQIGILLRGAFGNFVTFFSNSVGSVFQLLLVIVLTVMILSEPVAYRRLLLRFFPSFYRTRAAEILDKCESTLLHWLVGVSLSSLFVAGLSAVGLIVLGIPFVLAHALLAGVFNFIPNIGPTLSVVSPVSVALLQSPGKAIAVIVLYLIIQNAESYWLSPMLMKKQVSFLPAITLIAQLFFAHFFGLLGLVLALPLAIIAKIWIEEALIKDVLDQWNSRRTKAVLEVESTQLSVTEESKVPTFAADADPKPRSDKE